MQRIIKILVLIVLISTGCSALKKKAKEIKPVEGSYNIEQFISDVKGKNITNNNFYIGKADVHAKFRGYSQNLVVSVKFKRPDSALFVVRAKIGIEVGRVLITEDTVIINDRLNKRVILTDPKYFKRKYGLEPTLLSMIFGDFLLKPEVKEMTIDCVKNNAQLLMKESENVFYMRFDCDAKKLTEASIENLREGRKIDLQFSEFTEKENLLYPARSKMYMTNEKIEIDIIIEKIDTKWNGVIDFVANSNYKRKVVK